MKRAIALLIAVSGWILLACRPEPTSPVPSAGVEKPVSVRERAAELAQEALLADTHIDAPYHQEEEAVDLTGETSANFDYPKAKAGGLDAAFMSIYVPATLQERGGAKELADRLIDWVEGLASAAPDKFAVPYSTADVERHFSQGLVSLPMGMENGAPIEGVLDNLKHFHERGIRYITLTHSKANHICDSSYDEERRWNGLSPFGREVVAEMNRLGIMIDVSHVSDDTFYQVMDLSQAPVIASHSSCRKFTPDWERNMDDDMIRLLGENGGVIQINFGSAFLAQEAREQSSDFWDGLEAWAATQGVESDSPEVDEYRERYWQEHERIYATLDDVVAHIDHAVEIAGIDHVGLGSDFDGVGDSLPPGLKDVSGYPNLIAALLEKGYSEHDVRKICGANLMRVWREVERVAAELQAGT